MKTSSAIASVLVLAFLLLNVQFGAGQDSEPVAPHSSEFTRSPGAIPIQGRLTNASGVPLNGTFSMVFSLYEVETGGTAYCSDSQNVIVSNGLFNSYLDGCYYQGSAGPNYIYGQKLWLGVKVSSDPEMTPRQLILPVPYALTLSPGAYVRGSDNVDEVLTVEATGSGGTNPDWDALIAKAAGTGEAVEATATDGFAVYGSSATNLSIYGFSPAGNTVPAILGCKGTCSSYATSPTGVRGESSEGDGIQGISTDAAGRGLYGRNLTNIAILGYNDVADTTNHWKPTLYLVQENASGDFVVGAANYLGTRAFRIDRTGKGFFNGGVQASGADFAEQVAAEGPSSAYEPGDVLVISTSLDRSAARSSEPYSTLVLGVYSSEPGYLAGAPDTNDPLNGLPVAVVGIVPCKVSSENGPIQRGDLLVTSSTPGYAMRAGANPPVGTVLGKAMEPMGESFGLIQILVTLQ